MQIFLSIIFIVFGILQIILFFKIWRMTNDVKDIKSGNLEKSLIKEATYRYLTGDKDMAKKILDESAIKTLISARYGSELYQNEFYKIQSRYADLYKKMEIEPLDFSRYENDSIIP